MDRGLGIYRNSVGRSILRYRKQKGMSQAEIADFIGLARQTFSKVEQGIITLQKSDYIKIANYMGIPVELFYTNNSKHEQLISEIHAILTDKPESIDAGLSMCDQILDEINEKTVLSSQVVNLKGKLYYAKGYMSKAYQYWLKYHSEAVDLDDDQLLQNSLMNLSIASYRLKRYALSLKYVDQIFDHSKSKPQSAFFLQALNMKALGLIHTGKASEAIFILEDLKYIYEQKDILFELTKVHHNLGFAYSRLNQFEKSKEFYLNAMNYAFMKNNNEQAAESISDLAEIYFKEGNLEEAKNLLSLVFNVSMTAHFKIKILYYYSKCQTESQYKKKIMHQAISIASGFTDHLLLANIYRDLAELYEIDGDFKKSNDLNKQSNIMLRKKMDDLLDELGERSFQLLD